VENILIEDELCVFIRDLGEDLSSMELLLFFSRHPQARFNRMALLRAMSGKQFDPIVALKRLMDRKIIVTCNENGITLYALTKQEPAHSLAAELTKIDQWQWQKILGQILKAQGIQET